MQSPPPPFAFLSGLDPRSGGDTREHELVVQSLCCKTLVGSSRTLMSSMLAPLPCGFVAAMDTLDAMPCESVSELALAVLDVLCGAAQRVPCEEVHQARRRPTCERGTGTLFASDSPSQALVDAAGGAGAVVTLAEVHNSARALDYLYRTAVSRRASPVRLGDALSPHLAADGVTTQALLAAWQAKAEAALGEPAAAVRRVQALPGFGGLSWRVGVVLASWDAGRDAPGGAGGATQGAPPAAPRPYVNLSLRTQGGGCLRQHSLELSLADFKELAKAVRGVHKATTSIT